MAGSIPALGSFVPRAISQAVAGTRLEDWTAWCRTLIGGAAVPAALVIAGGSVTPTTGRFTVTTTLAADTLNRIALTNYQNGAVICVGIGNSANKVTFAHQAGGSGQLSLHDGNSIQATSTTFRIWFELQGTTWAEIQRFYGTMTGTALSALGLSAMAGYPEATTADAQAGTAADKGMTPRRVADAIAAPDLLVGGRTQVTAYLDTDEVVIKRASGLFRIPALNFVGSSPRGMKEFTVSSPDAGTKGQFAHLLGARPTLVKPFFRCTATDGEFTVGREVNVEFGGRGTNVTGVTVWADTVNLGFIIPNVSYPFLAADAAGNIQGLEPGKWVLIIRAWK